MNLNENIDKLNLKNDCDYYVIQLPNYDDGQLFVLDKEKNKFCHAGIYTNDDESIEVEKKTCSWK